jgi:nitroimidazol reductase NimA-like FMN-containing flavoprotein (pyridoxamine 5'-phosphate oxidase superfamily)
VGQAGGAGAHGEFIRLDRGESMRLLASARVGRLIFTVNAMPAVRLMNFVVVGELIVLRTAADSTVARKVHDVITAFEADDLDAATSSGWSVVVTGRATRVTDPELMARYRNVALVPWAPGDRDQFVTITTEVVEGRRVSRAAGSADPGRGQADRARDPRRG